MIQYFPKEISYRVTAIYLGVLLGVSALFLPYALKPGFLLLGVVSVVGFFFLSYYLSLRWSFVDRKLYSYSLFGIALLVRVLAMTALYFYFMAETGIPFEYQTADALGYHLDAEWAAGVSIEKANSYIFGFNRPVSDSGYLLYLSLLYRVIGPNIYLARLIKCLLGAFTCLFVYWLAARLYGEHCGRLAGIFCCLMPNLLYYSGMHLKETEMIFILVAAAERLDYVIRKERFDFWNTLLAFLLTMNLFAYRTVLGISMIMTGITAAAFGIVPKGSRVRHVVNATWMLLMLIFLMGGLISNDLSQAWDNRTENQISKREQQTLRGNRWAQYATGTVMAPMMFVIPFPTMVDTDQQYSQQMLNGGNYVRNVMGVFVLIAIGNAIFYRRKWRQLLLPLTLAASYLGIVCLSGFSNSERFVLPALPFLLILAARGVTLLSNNNYRWVKIWYFVLPLMSLGWAFFKLGSRGLL